MSLLLITAKQSILEHLKTRNGKPLTSFVYSAILLALVRPRCSGAGIKEDRNKEEINEPPASFRVVNFLWPA